MGQTTPENYINLIFKKSLSTEESFDPKAESAMDILGESSRQREESDVHMTGSSPKGEEPRGSFPKGKEPRPGRGSSPKGEAPQQDNASAQAGDATPMEAEDEDVKKEITSLSSVNPWLFYESGIICPRTPHGDVLMNSSGEKVINLREWDKLTRLQHISLRRQNIRRNEWERLPWTGHMCFLFTKAWEIGRLKSYYKRTQQHEKMDTVLESARLHRADWLRGAEEPADWKNRRKIPRQNWSEKWYLYERDLAIQKDMEFFSEAVCSFYQNHLEKMIKQNHLLWNDFGRVIGPSEVFPEPEKHFAFSTTLMVLATELYLKQMPNYQLSHYSSFAYRKLMEFIEGRKSFSPDAYRHFVEHVYLQFLQHESFHSSACSRTTTVDVGEPGILKTSTKLKAFTWVKNEAGGNQLPLLQVQVQQDATGLHGAPPQDDEEMEEVAVEDESSPQGEVSQTASGNLPQGRKPELSYALTPEARYGHYIISQLTSSTIKTLKRWMVAIGQLQKDDSITVPHSPDDVSSFQLVYMVNLIAATTYQEFRETHSFMTETNVSPEEFHEIFVACNKVCERNHHVKVSHFAFEDEPGLPVNPRSKDVEVLIPSNKHMILENDNSKLVDCTVAWMNMLNKDIQERILSRLQQKPLIEVKKEDDDQEVKEEQRKEPVIPPPKEVSSGAQSDQENRSEQKGNSPKGETPSSPTGSTKVEGVEKKDSTEDDTAPRKDSSTTTSTSRNTGNETDSILRNLSECFTDGCHKEWAGFYNKGFPNSPMHQHMFWHCKYRTTTEAHDDCWYEIPEGELMKEYIKRHKDQDVYSSLVQLRDSITYSCSDPRMHPRSEKECQKQVGTAFDRHEQDFTELEEYISDYINKKGCIPYATVLHLLAVRYLGAGLVTPDDFDENYPYRNSKSLSVMFWNLGNWKRRIFNKEPLPPNLEKFRSHIRADLDTEHQKLQNKPAYNNFFVSTVKNLKAHMFINCEAGSLYDSQDLLKETGWSICFNDWQDLMVAARLGRDGHIKQIAGYKTDMEDTRPRYVAWSIFEVKWGNSKDRLTGRVEELKRGRMSMCRVCVYHVNQRHITNSPAICGEIIATMVWECLRFEVDIIAGDGNKASYLVSPKQGGIPTYETSLLQFWIDRLVQTATQARRQIKADSVPVRAKHFISASYLDLKFLDKVLKNVNTKSYTPALMKKTSNKGDCCMMTMIEWGHSRNHIVDDVSNYDDEDHMNFHGEFQFAVNETCLSCDHEAFLVTENDRDVHNPLLIHFLPHITNQEAKDFRSYKSKVDRKRKRKEIKREKRQGYQQQDQDEDEEHWTHNSQQDWRAWSNYDYQQQGGDQRYSSSSRSTTWKSKRR